MTKCWICEQKEQWKRETYYKIRNAAIEQAKQTNSIVPIYKNGTIYQLDRAEGLSIVEYVSRHTEITPM